MSAPGQHTDRWQMDGKFEILKGVSPLDTEYDNTLNKILVEVGQTKTEESIPRCLLQDSTQTDGRWMANLKY